MTLKKSSFSQCVFDTSKSIDISQNRNKHVRLKQATKNRMSSIIVIASKCIECVHIL